MAIVKKYKAKIEKIENPLEDIYTVTFSSDKRFKYLPGQFLHLAIDVYDGVGQWPDSRCFSMQSNPLEDNIRITFAAKGNFTNRMKNELHDNKEVWLKLPYGDLFQRGHDKNNCVFIAGGTGVTPFLSLFNSDEFQTYVDPKIYLGFRTKAYNIYEEELTFVQLSENFVGRCETNVFYEDEHGILDINLIFNKNGKESTYFISGPPIMIKNFKKYLIGNGVNENKVITDDWE